MFKRATLPLGLPSERSSSLIKTCQKARVLKQFSSKSTKMAGDSDTTSNAGAAPANPFVLKPKYAEFAKVQAARPPFIPSLPIYTTQPPAISWTYGSPSPAPATSPSPSATTKPQTKATEPSSQAPIHLEIDPSSPDRTIISNYRLLVSAIPRPIALVSTVSADGIANLAPFSYFQIVDHDPPIFVLGFSARLSRVKDTQRNLVETGECVINIVSEHMVQGMNAASLDVPFKVSEWGLSGLTGEESTLVKPKRVGEAVFSIEGKLLEMKSLDYHGKGEEGKATGALAIIEGVRFWARGDAVAEEGKEVEMELEKLRPVVQLGGMMYGRVSETFELPRPGLAAELADEKKGLKSVLDREEAMERKGSVDQNST